ncbi:MAG: hypothetical protein ABIH03_08300 [Pseudomonadota bacterium]
MDTKIERDPWELLKVRPPPRAMRELAEGMLYFAIIPVCIAVMSWFQFGGEPGAARYAFGGAALVSALMFIMTVWGCSYYIRRWCCYRIARYRLLRYASAVPSDLLANGRAFYGYWPGTAAAIECHEGHLPGDCPLCGAT